MVLQSPNIKSPSLQGQHQQQSRVKSLQLIEKIGQGHFGRLYRARSSYHGWVAVKQFEKSKVWEAQCRGGRWPELLHREMTIHQE
jgi:serine/threonine protein kinase